MLLHAQPQSANAICGELNVDNVFGDLENAFELPKKDNHMFSFNFHKHFYRFILSILHINKSA